MGNCPPKNYFASDTISPINRMILRFTIYSWYRNNTLNCLPEMTQLIVAWGKMELTKSFENSFFKLKNESKYAEKCFIF